MKMKRMFIVMIAAMLFTLLGVIGGQPEAMAQGGSSIGGEYSPGPGYRSPTGRKNFPGTTVTFTGKFRLNKRVVYKNDPSVTFVIGTVSGKDDNGIYLDGEYFSLTMAELVDSHGVPFTMDRIFYGMRVNIRIESGAIKKVFAENLNTRVIRGNKYPGAEDDLGGSSDNDKPVGK